MPKVLTNMLIGNYAEAYVTSILSSECLVRKVSEGTDIGVDLYCEIVKDGKPFLHFWMQVKGGTQCKVIQKGKKATCSFKFDHLRYWNEQPVPIFIALVPAKWPVKQNPKVYVIDVSSRLLEGIKGIGTKKTNLHSEYVWNVDNREDIRNFLTSIVPATDAKIKCKYGVVSPIKTITPSYEISTPTVPVKQFKKEISDQIRRTAAMSILMLDNQNNLTSDNEHFRRIMAAVVQQFHDSTNWENFMARAISHEVDKENEQAVKLYKKAKTSILADRNVRDKENWKKTVADIEKRIKFLKRKN